MSGLFASVLVKDEGGTYGGGGTFTRALEVNSEAIAGQYGRVESSVMRSGSRLMRADRWQSNPKGAAGDLTLDVLTRGFGGLLPYIFGGTPTWGSSPTDSAYSHSGGIGSLTGKSFALQAQRPLVGGDPTVSGGFGRYNYKGGKVASWEFSNDVDGTLQARLSCDFQTETVGASYVAPTYPSGVTEVFTFVGGSVTINGTQVPVKNVNLSGSNGLNTDRYFVNAATTKAEPLESALRDVSVSFEVDFDSTRQAYYDTNVVAGTTLTNVVLKWLAATKLGASAPSTPALTFTMPVVRLDEGTPTVAGPDLVGIPLSGKALEPAGGGTALTWTLVTGESNVNVVY